MSAEQAAVLVEFARACRAAARSVSLYPATHPSIQVSLERVILAAGRLAPAGTVTLAVHPGTLMIDGKAPARGDQALEELAGLMKDRLVGALRLESGADIYDWHALLLLLVRPLDELSEEGGIARAWTKTRRNHFEIFEIDYAEVLRERSGGSGTEWDQIINLCLQGEGPLDKTALTALLATLGDSARFGELIERLQSPATGGDATASARAAALLALVKEMLDASAEAAGEGSKEGVLQTVADSSSRLTPDMLIAIIEQARSPDAQQADIAAAVVDRMGDDTIASFVAGNVARENGASERLAQALQLLVPDIDRKERLIDLAKQEAGDSPLGQQAGFEELWESAANMLASYSDESFVSAEYGRELSTAQQQALDVARVSDDPPDRIQAWLSTVEDDAIRALDFQLLLDLLKVETDPDAWRDAARLVVSEIEKRVQSGDPEGAQKLAFAIVREIGAGGRERLRAGAESAVEALASVSLARHIAAHLRKVEDAEIDPYNRLCRTIGAGMIGPLAEVLIIEENSKAIRRLRELLFGFGAAGRETVERLKRSPNPTVRRTAIDMLRMFGGQDALADLATMLEDREPQVQRDAIKAIAQLGNDEAFAVLQKALMSGTVAGNAIPQQLITLKEERAAPLLCYVLTHTVPRGRLIEVHTQIMEALGALGSHPESIATLQTALYRGEWWAPTRTAALRRAAALALGRIGSPEAREVLEEAKKRGSRGVRTAARLAPIAPPRRQQERT
jgi:HEAT repeat protein